MSESDLAARAAATGVLSAPVLAGYDVRPMVRDDVDAVLGLVRLIETADQVGWRMPAGDLAEPFADPWWAPGPNTLLITPIGPAVAAPVGWAVVTWRPGAVDAVRVHVDGGVHPGHRGRGMGRALVAWQVARARQVFAAADEQYLPGVVDRWVEPRPNGLPELLSRQGFEPARTYLEMALALDSPLPERGVTGVEFSVIGGDLGLGEGARRVNNVGFAEHHGSQPFDPETWQRQILQRDTSRLDLSMVALDPSLPADDVPDRAVGLLLTGLYPDNWPSPQRPEGWVDDLAVLPGHRGRGIGKALLVEALHTYREHGMVSAGLMADSENGSGAVGLYESVGFRTRRTVISYELRI